MKTKDLYLFSLCALAATAVLAAEGEGETPSTDEPEFNRVVENYNNPDGMVDDVVENLHTTGGDAANYGVFYVHGDADPVNVIVKSDANFANRNGGANLWITEGSSITFLPASGVWNENFYGEGSGYILLESNASMTIGSSEQAADLNNNNDAIVDLSEGSTLRIYGNLYNRNNAQVNVVEGSTLEVMKEIYLDATSKIIVSSTTVENSNGSLRFAGGADKGALFSLDNSVFNTKSFFTNFWEGTSDSVLELKNSTINAKENSSNRWITNVSGTSYINFENEVTETTNEDTGETTSTITYRELLNYGELNLDAASTLKINGKLSNNENGEINLSEGSTLEVANEIWILGSSSTNVNGATLKSGASLLTAADATATLTFTNSTVELGSITIGLWTDKHVNTTLNIDSSTIKSNNGDSTNRGDIYVNGTSNWIFGEVGRALFNRDGGTIKIKSNQSLNISRIREEGSDDSYFCNYGTIVVEAATDTNASAAITVTNFVDDGNAGTIVIDFSNISDIYDKNEYALISASSVSIDNTLFQYTLDGSTFKDILLGDSVQDGGLFLELKQDGSTISYIYSFVPEPSTYAAIFGALALALACYRRRASRN